MTHADPRIQERLARRIRGESARSAPARSPARAASADAPLSFTQEAVWLHCQLDDADSTLYNLATCLRVRGDIAWADLDGALRAVVDRHDILRTSVTTQAGRPRQVRHLDVSIEPLVFDYSSLPPDEAEALMRVESEGVVATPFDLAVAPLARFCIFRLPARESAVLIVAHHVVFDGWSFGLLLQELVHHYSSRVSGVPGPGPLPMQFADYAESQRSPDARGLLASSVAYWEGELAGLEPHEVLLPDVVAARRASYDCARSTFWIGEAQGNALAGAARAIGVSEFALFAASLFACLHRFGGQDDIACVTPVSSRDSAETQQLIGPLMGLVLLRAQVRHGEPFAALARRVHSAARRGIAHQDVPFERILGIAGGAGGGGTAWRPELALYWDDTPVPDAFSLEGLMGYREAVANQRTGYPLTVIVQSNLTAARSLVTIEYASAMFRAETIESLSQSLLQIIGAVGRSPHLPVSALPVMDIEVLKEVLRRSEGPVCVAASTCVHDLVLQRGSTDPDALAVLCGDEQVSYGELCARVAVLTWRMLSLGVQHEQVIGICADRSIGLVVAVLAVMNAGAAYLPLDDRLPAARLAFMLQDSRSSLLLVDERAASNAAFDGIPQLRIDELASTPGPGGSPVPRPHPNSLAYMIYTSGSTGRPKGVMVSHGALANVIGYFSRRLRLQRDRAMLFTTSLSFDISGLELFVPLIDGATVVVCAADIPAVHANCTSARERFGNATAMQATPTTWSALLDDGWRPEPGQVLLCGGERLPAELSHRLVASGAELWNVYGPTETTIWSTCGRCGSAVVDIGTPISSTSAYVLDGLLQPVPPHAIGDLYLGGEGLARGYWGDPARTAERFVPNPFARGARLYRTGDRARWAADGRLEFVGRVDHQVKIRGHRVELGEIEAVAAGRPDVAAAVAMLSEAGPAGASITLHVVAREGRTVDVDGLGAALRSELPAYMQPAGISVLDRLPVTASGKVDRVAIERHRGRPWIRQSAYAAAQTATERALVEIWSESIGVPAEDLGIDTDFLDLGAHSLTAMRVLAHVRDRFGTRLPLEAVFENTTVRQLGRHIDLQLWLADQRVPQETSAPAGNYVEGIL